MDVFLIVPFVNKCDILNFPRASDTCNTATSLIGIAQRNLLTTGAVDTSGQLE